MTAYTGSIPEEAHTYNVVGNANEFGVIIAGHLGVQRGRRPWHGCHNGLRLAHMDDASTLAHSTRSHRHHGHAGAGARLRLDGESFAIADGDEVWLLEMGAGRHGRGAVGGNESSRRTDRIDRQPARIRTFPRDDPDNACTVPTSSRSHASSTCTHPPPELDFSFSDVYDPLTFSGARHGESRVWSVFQAATGGAVQQFAPYARHRPAQRMPLFVQPAQS